MAEYLLSKPSNHHYHHHLLFSDLELLNTPPPVFHPSFPNALRPFCRGPMYSTYAKLRDQMRWVKKKAKLGLSTPIPLPLKISFALSKENRKPPLRFDTFMTPPPPMASKPELRKSVSVSVERMEEKERRSGGLFSVRRSFSGLNEVKEISMIREEGIKEKGRGRPGGSQGSLRKSVTGFGRPKLMKAMG